VVPRASHRDRLAALDGLRGIAALVVVLSHVVAGSVGALSATLTLGGDPGGLAHWFMRTPLAVVWAGPEFVIVFFVLSGFVLTRALRTRPVALRAFYAGRIVRLYLPAWLSLIPAALLLMAFPSTTHDATGVGFWLQTYTQPVGLDQVARDAALVLPLSSTHATLNGALWSLRWEVLFSLALPFLLLAATPLRRLSLPVVLMALLCVDFSAGHPAMAFLPPFAVGLVLALHEERIARWREELGGRGAVAFLAATLCLLGADLWLPTAVRAQGPGGAMVVAGAAAAVLCPLLYGSVARNLQRRPVQWLGSRSFSLYLVHHPIVVACTGALHRPGLVVLLVTAVPVSFLAAEAFFRAVERPAHRVAREATRQLGARRTIAAVTPARPQHVGVS
jgi:peptidoglycan/LPS O-acetylase OafA/YrhL